jgi:tRNA pseudouridine65 synthase
VLSQSFEAQEVHKRYLALVRGRLLEAGTIDYAIPKGENKAERVDAVTDYRPLLVLDRFTLVEAVPRTGRLRQIRRHLKHLGHPIVLDKRHGRGEFHALARERYGFERMVLHARAVTFPHPVTGRRIEITAPLQDLEEPFARLGAGVDVLADPPGIRLLD